MAAFGVCNAMCALPPTAAKLLCDADSSHQSKEAGIVALLIVKRVDGEPKQPFRAVVVGMTLSEIARRTETALGTTKTRMRCALKYLRSGMPSTREASAC